jgi:phosphoribosyl-AMP cyclohydrolase
MYTFNILIHKIDDITLQLISSLNKKHVDEQYIIYHSTSRNIWGNGTKSIFLVTPQHIIMAEDDDSVPLQ